MSDYLTPKAREHFERASAKGCVCGLCELIAALPETIREVKAQALEEAADAFNWAGWHEDYKPFQGWLRTRSQQLKEDA